MISFLLFLVFGLAALALGVGCAEPIKRAVGFVFDWAKAQIKR